MDWTPRRDKITKFNAGALHPSGTEDFRKPKVQRRPNFVSQKEYNNMPHSLFLLLFLIHYFKYISVIIFLNEFQQLCGILFLFLKKKVTLLAYTKFQSRNV